MEQLASMESSESTPPTPIAISEVAESDRSGFFTALCAGHQGAAFQLEVTAFNLASLMLEDYKGGHWALFTAANGARFMVPPISEEATLANPNNGIESTVSRIAAGMAITFMAYSSMSFWCHEHGLDAANEAISDHFYLLRDLIVHHPESSNILWLCD